MIVNLLSESMLGHWDISEHISQCEYQFGRRLVYVQYPKQEKPIKYLESAQKIIKDVWEDIENAIIFAEKVSRKRIPDYWEQYDKSGISEFWLDVHAINFNLKSHCPIYDISTNYDFKSEYIFYEEEDYWQEAPIKKELPLFPDGFSENVKWLSKNDFELVL